MSLGNFLNFFNPHLRICLLILEREEEAGRERQEKNINQFASCTEDQTPNLGMCPDQESNPKPSGGVFKPSTLVSSAPAALGSSKKHG